MSLDSFAIVFSILIILGTGVATLKARKDQRVAALKRQERLDFALYTLLSYTWAKLGIERGNQSHKQILTAGSAWVVKLYKEDTDHFREIVGSRRAYIAVLEIFEEMIRRRGLVLCRHSIELGEGGRLQFMVRSISAPRTVEREKAQTTLVRNLVSPFDVLSDEVVDIWDWVVE